MSKADSIKARLLSIAIKSGKTNEYIQTHYFIERLLYRLSISRFANEFVLKGGLLLHAIFDNRARATRDIDLLARQISNIPDQMINVFREICAIPVDDGVTFDEKSISAEPITEDADYTGIRLKVVCFLDRTQSNVQFDIGFGDVIVPKPERMMYPSLLGMEEAKLLVYSKESIIAEKFQAMVYLAQANSRMKDFYDIAMLASSYDYDGAVLREAVAQTLERRATPMAAEPIIFTDAFAADADKQKQWAAFAARIKLTDTSFENELAIICAFLRPVYQAIIHEKDFLMTWRHTDRAWT